MFGGKLADAEGHFDAAGAQPGRAAHRHADEPRGPDRGAARDRAPQPGPRRPGLSAGHAAASARATTPSRPDGAAQRGRSPPSRVDRAGAEARAAKGVAVITAPENRWGRCDIKTVGLLPNVAGQAGGARGGRRRGLVRRRPGPGHRGRLVQRLDRRRRRARCAPATPRPTSCAASPARTLMDVIADEGLEVDERPFTVDEAKRGAGRPSSPAPAPSSCRSSSIDGKSRSATASPGPVATRLRALYIEQAQARRRSRALPRRCSCAGAGPRPS